LGFACRGLMTVVTEVVESLVALRVTKSSWCAVSGLAMPGNMPGRVMGRWSRIEPGSLVF
jgi:hypothetical protein